MNLTNPDHKETGRPRGRGLLFNVSLFLVGVFLVYFIILRFTNRGVVNSLVSSLCSVTPLAVLGLAVRSICRRYMLGRRIIYQAPLHVLFAALFSGAWYWILMVLEAMVNGTSLLHFDVRAYFPDAAVAWQLVHGLTFYGLIVALTYLEAYRVLLDSRTEKAADRTYNRHMLAAA